VAKPVSGAARCGIAGSKTASRLVSVRTYTYTRQVPRPNRDLIHLSKLRDRYREHGTVPSFSQIAGLLGFASKTAVTRLVGRLAAAGYIEQAQDGRLKPGGRFFEVPIPDQKVRAGTGEGIVPEMATDAATISGLLEIHSSSVLIKVKGDSMREAGVLGGDYALVDREAASRPGDIVLAYVDGSFTVKELRHRAGKPLLIAHDGRQTIIEAREHLEILGVVRGIVRKYPRLRMDRRGATK